MASTESVHDPAAAASVPCTGNDPVDSCAVSTSGHVVFDDAEICQTGTERCASGTGQPTSPERPTLGSDVVPEGQEDMHAGGRHGERPQSSFILALGIEHHSEMAMSFVVDAPIVRVHVVDADTGSYLKRTDHTSTGLRFLERQEQQSMLEAPGHETMTTVYQRHAHGAMEASPSILSHVPPIQTQEGRPRGVATAAATFEWNEVLYIDIPYEDTLLKPSTSTLLLLEVLQHPSSVKTWTHSRRKFSGGCHRSAWAFLDCSNPRTRAALQYGMERKHAVGMDLQLHRWPNHLRSRTAASSADCGAVYAAFQHFSSGSARFSETEPATLTNLDHSRSLSASLESRKEVGRAGKSLIGATHNQGLGVPALPCLCITVGPSERVVQGVELLQHTLAHASNNEYHTMANVVQELHPNNDTLRAQQTCAHGAMVFVHSAPLNVEQLQNVAGFGSGWDNFRGTPGHVNVSRPSAAGEIRERDGRRRQLLSLLQRQPLEPCRLPNEVHSGMCAASGALSLDTQSGVLKGTSASVTSFSPSGLLLAIAVEEAPKQWSVKIFDAISCELAAPGRLEAHCNIIYDLTWSADSRVLVSCSSDCTAKVWYLDAAASHSQRNHGPFAAPQLCLPYCTVLHHPTYAYCCKLHPNASFAPLATAQQESGSEAKAHCEDTLLLVTGCADGLLYFWGLNADMNPLLTPDGAEPLLRQPGGLTLQATGASLCMNALLWDVSASSQPHDATVLHASGYALESQDEAALHASSHKSSGGEPCTTTHGENHHSSSHEAAAHGPTPRSQHTHGSGSRKQAHQHRSVLFSGDSDGHVLKWAVDVAELLQGSSQAVVMVKSCHVGAPVSSLASTPTTSKLAAVTKSSRIVIVHKESMDCIMALEGASCTKHPLKAAMDPARGRWLLVGSEQGVLYAFNLSIANVGPSGVLLPELQAALTSGGSAGREAAVYCVAWNSKLHLIAACSRHSEGCTVVLCGMPGEHERRRPLFVPYISKNRAGMGSTRVGGLSSSAPVAKATTQGSDPQTACARRYNTARYRLPDELDSVFIKSLLHRIRADLHEKGFLGSPTMSLTRGRH